MFWTSFEKFALNPVLKNVFIKYFPLIYVHLNIIIYAFLIVFLLQL